VAVAPDVAFPSAFAPRRKAIGGLAVVGGALLLLAGFIYGTRVWLRKKGF